DVQRSVPYHPRLTAEPYVVVVTTPTFFCGRCHNDHKRGGLRGAWGGPLFWALSQRPQTRRAREGPGRARGGGGGGRAGGRLGGSRGTPGGGRVRGGGRR